MIVNGSGRNEHFSQELPVVAILVKCSGRNEQSLQMTAYICFLRSCGSIGQLVLAENNFKNQPNRKTNHLWGPRLLTDRDEKMIFRWDLPQMLLTKCWVIWQSGFREEEFQKSTNQKQEFPVAATFVNGSGRNEQSVQMTFHRCFLPRFGSFGQSVSEEKKNKNQPIRNKNHLWRPCMKMDRDEMSNS